MKIFQFTIDTVTGGERSILRFQSIQLACVVVSSLLVGRRLAGTLNNLDSYAIVLFETIDKNN